VSVDAQQALPANGVYICAVEIAGEQYGAVTNVGTRPTFDGVARRVEAYLLDFGREIYGESVRVRFLHRLRAEQKFDGIAALIAQITQDVADGRAYLAAHRDALSE
jgi:riboflavin kinase/FMN adenylyltransferase